MAKKDAEALQLARGLVGMKMQAPETAVNSLYQELVERHIRPTAFFGAVKSGGVEYSITKQYHMVWPGPEMKYLGPEKPA